MVKKDVGCERARGQELLLAEAIKDSDKCNQCKNKCLRTVNLRNHMNADDKEKRLVGEGASYCQLRAPAGFREAVTSQTYSFSCHQHCV